MAFRPLRAGGGWIYRRWPKGVRIALRPERNIFVAVSAATLFPFVILPRRAWQGMLSSNSNGGPYGQTILAGRL